MNYTGYRLHFLLFLLTGGLTVCAQGSASRAAAIADRDLAEERYQRLNSAVEGLLATQVETQRRLNAMADQLRSQSRTASGGVTRAELDQVLAAVREIDRKRQADKQEILKEISGLAEVLLRPASAGSTTTKARTYEEYTEHTVQSGETLLAIVRAYNTEYKKQGRKTSLELVLDANPKVKPKELQVGQKITIPLVRE